MVGSNNTYERPSAIKTGYTFVDEQLTYYTQRLSKITFL